MPLLNTPFQPGQCRAAIAAMPQGPRRDIAVAEYCYFSGQAEKAVRKAELYLTHPDWDARLSACLIYAYANLTLGQIHQTRVALTELQTTLTRVVTNGNQGAAAAFVGAAAAVLLHLPLPEQMPPAGEFLPQLPPGLRAFALYVQAYYLYLKEDYARSAGQVGAVTPENLLAAGEERLRACGFSGRKANYMLSAARAVEDGTLDIHSLVEKSDEEIIRELTVLPGVGRWTAEMLLTFSLQRPDVLAYDDFGIRKGMCRLYGLDSLTKQQFAGYRARYAPHATVAALYLWHIATEP